MDFIIRNKFWLGLGAVTLLAIILFVMGPLKAMGQNDEMFSTLEDRAEDLERFARDQVKNEKWQDQQQRIQLSMEKQLRQIQEQLLARDALLERSLKDPTTGEEGPLEFGRFTDAYDQKMNDLAKILRESVIELPTETPLVHVELGTEWMPRSVLHQHEKKVWVQEAIVEAVADVNSGAAVVPVFLSLEFLDQPERLLSDAHRERFETIPFELQVAMEFEFYPLFLQRLLETPLGLEITSTHLERYEAGEGGGATPGRAEREREERASRPRTGASGRPPGMGEMGGEEMYRRAREERPDAEEDEEEIEEKEPLPNDLVLIYIRGYVPDYLPPDEEGTEGEDEAEGSAGSPGGGAPGYGPPGAPGPR
jgi:hypothetical protein